MQPTRMHANTQRISLKRVLRTTAAFAATVALVTTASALGQAGLRLFVGGKTASTDIRIIGGRPYVPLADMAKAMNGTAVKHKGGGYEITLGSVDTTTPEAGSKPGGAAVVGGANEVRGTQGKIGQVLFNGKWRFSVLSVARAASYDSQFLADKHTFVPAGDTEELVIVRCRMKNGQKDTQMAMLSQVHPHHTGLADNQGQSYAPMDYDKRGGSSDEGPKLLPGAQTEFAILFSVPKGTVLKDLVFSIQNAYEDTPEGGTDVRITLVE
jgi:hypothetical protein